MLSLVSCLVLRKNLAFKENIPSQTAVSANNIAITLDDLPGAQDESAEILQEINDQILTALNKFNAPAIGFVNEYKLYVNNQTIEKIAILKSWIDRSKTLGNHTYSHNHLRETELGEYRKKTQLKALKSPKNL